MLKINSDVVLDTNILVSALWSANGTPAQIVENMGELTVYYNDEIMAEYKDVLLRDKFKGRFTDDEINGLLMYIEKFGKNIVAPKSDIPLPDEKDRIFYDTAKGSGSFLITGNVKHYPKESFILTPAEFLNLSMD